MSGAKLDDGSRWGVTAMGCQGATVNKPLRSPSQNLALAWGEGGSWIQVSGCCSEGFDLRLISRSQRTTVENNVTRISLTETQVRQLTPFFDRVRSAAAQGSPGMLIAQVRWSTAEQRYWMEPGFLPHEHAALIAGKGQTCPPALPPTNPAGNTEPASDQTAPGAA
jgi:hypothetical protein